MIQQDEARAMFAVAKNKIGSITLDGDKGMIPDLSQANSIALGVKRQLISGGIGFQGTLTVPNGRGTRKTKKADVKAVEPVASTGPNWTQYNETLPDEACDLRDEEGKLIFSPDTFPDEYTVADEGETA